MNLLQKTYPRFYVNMTSNELKETSELWAEFFSNDELALVALAVKSLITTLEYPPTIADVKKEITKLTSAAAGEPTSIDEWNAIRKALKNSIYGAEEEFKKLPPIAKRFVGFPQQLRDWGMMCDFNADVVRGQFLKQYDALKERQRYAEMLNGQQGLRDLLNNSSLKAIEGGSNV